MIKVENLSFSYPQKDLYKEISFTLEDNQHCAFIGTNGTGKSTLIDMIMDPDRFLFDGKIEKSPNCRIGYVSQFSKIEENSEITVFDYISTEFVKLEGIINSICEEMGTATDIEPLLEKYQEALDAFQAIDGDNYDSNIKKQLKLANLNKNENQMVSKLSSGEFKLVQVIKEMILRPNLLIMDEPDVFLDFDHINGLRNLINTHKGTLLVITHNRYLLNHCFNKILHLEGTEIQEFDGKYIEYNFSLLETKIELQELADADTKEIERNRQVVDRLRSDATKFTSASRGRALHARVSFLERLEARRIKAPFVEIKQPDIHFTMNNELEETTALAVHDYSVEFDEVLLENICFEIKSTDKVAIVGQNGAGKTTLFGQIKNNKHEGIEINPDVKMALLSQIQGEMFEESSTILEVFYKLGFESNKEIRLYLANYGFEREVLTSKIEALSGGEKNLLQLAIIGISDANMLLLDEPTSHLDTYAQIALEKAIGEYKGAILMVSHDFYTIANCMHYVLFIEGKTIRKMSIRKFRKMIYANHFNKEYLEIENKKKELETRIALALRDNKFEVAKELAKQLEGIIKLL